MATQEPTKNGDVGKIPLIQGFKGLFASDTGIRQGASLLISGPPGSGKTTFALAVVRALMAQSQLTRTDCDSQHHKPIAYYISSEVDQQVLTRAYGKFGWFAQSSGLSADDEPFHFRIDDPSPDRTNFYTIAPMPEVDRPVPSPEELVNGIFNRIAHTLIPSESPKETAPIYIIVDSISALLKGCLNSGDERRQTHEIMHRLRDLFDNNLMLTILLAEQDHRTHERDLTKPTIMPTTPSVEDYLADIVFRLYVQPLPLGRRSRVLEVVKSQGVNMILGEHSWQIITKDNFKLIMRHKHMQLAIKEACLKGIDPATARDLIDRHPASEICDPRQMTLQTDESQQKAVRQDEDQPWGGIIIFPRPKLQRTALTSGKNACEGSEFPTSGADGPGRHSPGGQGNTNTEPAILDSGTEGLDSLNIKSGTTTLIAGPVGSGKTTLCKQFLKSMNPPPVSAALPVLISFDIYPAGKEDAGIETLDFTQTKFDLNVLVAHIDWILGGVQIPERLAFDGLSEWITMFDEPEAARMLEALMITVMRQEDGRRPPAVFMTYALGLDENPLVPHALGMNAENIVVVRQIAINDQLRRILYILKNTKGSADPEVPRELLMDKESSALAVVPDTLDYYTGLLGRSGDVRPARVLLLLFAENKSEKKLNAKLYKALSQQHRGRLDISYSQFSRSEISTTLDSVTNDPSQRESASLKVQSVDEWWLGSKKTCDFLYPVQEIWTVRTEKSRKGLETIGWCDFWTFEVEKAKFDGAEGIAPGIHAVPGYMDFGMFCINYDLWVQSKPSGLSLDRRSDWEQILSEVPRLWVWENSAHWFSIYREGERSGNAGTVLGYALQLTNQNNAKITLRKPVFAFDVATRETCVCTFFEFAWAFGAHENMLAVERVEEIEIEKARACKALTFLQFMVLEGLMFEGGTTSDLTEPSKPLFSRHFYSTQRQEQDSPIIALPFMPTGLSDRNHAINSALNDIRSRLEHWCKRLDGISSDQDISAINIWLNTDDSKKDVRTRVNAAINCYTKCREIVLSVAGRAATRTVDLTWSKTADVDDLIELTIWAAFRLQLLIGSSGGDFPNPTEASSGKTSRIASAMRTVRDSHRHLPVLRSLRKNEKLNPILTGYGCTGSWMYGISKRSRAPALQAQILREITSLDWAEKRAKSGSGMPARKDFFHLHGSEKVPGIDYLNWREFLRYNGCRARRRDRVLKTTVEGHTVYGVIHRELLACLRIAGLYKEQYAAKIENDATPQQAIDAVVRRAKTAVETIFTAADCGIPNTT